ncbi:MAG: CopD family protein [Planctomycetota bacterium]
MLISLALHTLATILWVGGMFFAYVCLRPAVGRIEPPEERLKLWRHTFARFFPWVWLSIAALLGSGLWITLVPMGGFGKVAVHVHIMMTLGILMMALFARLFFAGWRKFAAAVDAGEFEPAKVQLARIRHVVAVNLILGVATAVIGVTGKYWG